MKKYLTFIVLNMLLFSLIVSPALALQDFQQIHVNGNLRLSVYSAPSSSSWRGANGKAMCNTDGAVFAAGRDGSWVLIAYYLNHGPNQGGYRVGYVRYSELTGLIEKNLPQLSFQYRTASITASCNLTDDPLEYEEPITRLSPGTKVTYLMGYENEYGTRFAYIETTYQWQTVRGFVRLNCIQLSQ